MISLLAAIAASVTPSVVTPLQGGAPVDFDATRLSPGACVDSVQDQASAACIDVSSVPILGTLYPLGIELNIDTAGRVLVGTLLSVAESQLQVVSNQEDRSGFFASGGNEAPGGSFYGGVAPCSSHPPHGNGGEGIVAQGGASGCAWGGVGLRATGGSGDFGGAGIHAVGQDGADTGGDGIIVVAGEGLSSGGDGLVATGSTAYFPEFVGGRGVVGRGSGGGIAQYGGTGVVGTAGVGTTENGFGVFAQGDLGASGVKSFVQPHPEDPGREIRFAALEGNEVGTYFRGTDVIRNGTATIDVPEEFRWVSEPDGLTVQLTPVGARAVLWVVSQDPEEIRVGGDADVTFHYAVQGVRRGFADFEPVRPNHSFVPRWRDEPYGDGHPKAVLRMLVENGTLRPDRTPDYAAPEGAAAGPD